MGRLIFTLISLGMAAVVTPVCHVVVTWPTKPKRNGPPKSQQLSQTSNDTQPNPGTCHGSQT